jgi:hypothetical protein
VDETQKKEISRERKTCFAHKNLGTEYLKQNTTWAILYRIAGQRAKRWLAALQNRQCFLEYMSSLHRL